MNKKVPRLSKISTINLILFGFICFFATFCIIISQEYQVPSNNINYINFDGNYVVNSSDTYYRIPPDKVLSTKNVNNIKFDIKFNEDIPKGEQINIFTDKVILNVYYKNNLIHTYGNSETHPNIVRSVGSCWTSFISPGIDKGEIVQFYLKSSYSTIYNSYINKFLSNISTGAHYSLLKMELEKNFWIILGIALTFITGFFMMAMMLTFKLMKTPYDTSSLSCSFHIMVGSLSLLFNSDYITLIFENAFLINIVRYVLLMLTVYFFLLYIRIYLHNTHLKNALNYIITTYVLMMLSFFIFQSTGVLDYHQFNDYILNAVAVVIIVIFLFLFIDYKKNTHIDSKTLLNSTLILCLCMAVEIIYKINTGDYLLIAFECGLVLFSSLQFLVIMFVSKRNFLQASRTEKVENELLQSKISVMLSQIQPHFLYNTLVVIRQLCDINPKIAKEAITEFANYLRGNLDSLTLNSTISFEKEMEHVENYVSLEKKRFGDRINIEYEIEAIDFQVPSLTIQTVVENAIRHGISKRKEGGTVTIRTAENENTYTIEIHDNGIGVDITQLPTGEKDNRSHIGVDNSRKRIEAMCNGELKFSSTPGIGTTVLITIPKTSNEK